MKRSVHPSFECGKWYGDRNNSTQPKSVQTFAAGDAVRYDPAFLGRVQDPYERLDLSGVVRDIKEYRRDETGESPYQIVTVEWSDSSESKVRDYNLNLCQPPSHAVAAAVTAE